MDRTHHNDNPEASERGVPAGMEMDSGMMWAMIACCIAIPVALILGVVAGGGLIGGGGWVLVFAGAVAVALVIARQRTVRSRRRPPSDVDA